MTESVLIIDDEVNLLQGVRRRLRKQFDLSTAEGGLEALELVRSGKKFSVVVSDMQMPGMSGVETLSAIKEISPDTVAIMLTGNADQKTAVDAINKGNIFRFFSKPCPMEILAEGIEDALKQYRLVMAERELLNQTLSGSVKVLIDMLSLIDPASFSHSNILKAWAGKVVGGLNFNPGWMLGLAAMLSPIGYVAVPPTVRHKVNSGADLSDDERLVLSAAPETAYRLLENIPRLKGVAEFIRFQDKYFDGRGFPKGDEKGSTIPEGARILSILIGLSRESKGSSLTPEIFEVLRADTGRYDLGLLMNIEECLLRPPEPVKAPEDSMDPIEQNAAAEAGEAEEQDGPIMLPLKQLSPGHILVSNLETEEGHLILAGGMQLTAAQIELLKNHARLNKVKEPIEVSALLPEPQQI